MRTILFDKKYLLKSAEREGDPMLFPVRNLKGESRHEQVMRRGKRNIRGLE